jgi:Ca2+-transporting ATPase
MLVWLGIVGLVMGLSTLAVQYWANHVFDDATARTMGLCTFAIANIFLGISTRDERRSILDPGYFEDRPLLIGVAAAVAATILQTEFGLFRRILDTTNLTLDQWLVCILVGGIVLVVYEIRKAVFKTQVLAQDEAETPTMTPATTAA